MCYLFDVLPTLGHLGGVRPPATSEGIDLGATLRNPAKPARRQLMFAYRNVQRAVRDGRWKLIRYPEVGRTQLFDLQVDPQETHNLAGNPMFAARVTRMTGTLGRLQKEFADAAPLTVHSSKSGNWTPPDPPK
jgi:arylsulfatase A-like enzyme